MSKPIIHAQSSARRYGGKPDDYFPIHDFLDSSKSTFPDNRHRALTHNSWFLFVLEQISKPEVGWNKASLTRPSDGKVVSVRLIGEQHILEDFGGRFIPAASDYLAELDIAKWMNAERGHVPPSHTRIANKLKEI